MVTLSELLAISFSSPIASNTRDGSSEPALQALPLDAHIFFKSKLSNNPSASTPSKEILALIKETIESEKLAKIDYIEIVDSLSLKPVDKIEKSVLVALAVYIGKTRLIDNFIFEV